MAMTITEKILALHAGKEKVEPGELIQVNVDLALANDITAPLAIQVFNELGTDRVFDREKIALVPDHFVPNKDIESAQQVSFIRKFAEAHKIKHFFELGEAGVEHVILPEKGMVISGDLVIGADSHTCTYGALGAFSAGVGSTDLGVVMATGQTWLKVPSAIKTVFEGTLQPWVGGKDLILHVLGLIGVEGAVYQTLEFTGETIKGLSMDQRFTMANMAVEAGAKNGIFEPDEITKEYIQTRTSRKPLFLKSDQEAVYSKIININVDEIPPLVAAPHSPGNVHPVYDFKSVKLDQVVIGSCTNGRKEDMQTAAKLLKNRRVSKGTRLIILPGSSLVYKEAVREGIISTMLEAGAVIGPPCCGPCLGGHMGILAEGETALSTTNRNFIGRMGHPDSLIYLANPAVAAASAILGRIASPEDL